MFEYLVAGVYVLDAPYHIDRIYDYLIPDDLREEICAGIFAAVPFGNANRMATALVMYVRPEPDEKKCYELKPVRSAIPESTLLTKEQLGLVDFLKERCFCTSGDAVHAIIPSAVTNEVEIVYKVTSPHMDTSALTVQRRNLYGYIAEHSGVNIATLHKIFFESGDRDLIYLCKNGYVVRDFEFKKKKTKKYLNYLTLTESAYPYLNGEKKLRSPAQLDVLRFVCECVRATDKYIKEESGCNTAVIRSLITKGLLAKEEVDIYRNPYDLPEGELPKKKLVLNDEQTGALEKLAALANEEKPCAALLHGVTGSGKTSVIKALADRVLAMGKQVIILVPEIALTPQTLSVFGAYYGDNIAVMHSSLSQGERYDAYRRMEEGLVNVCIGTRSAIFAPFKNLGLIVIDEEQEHTYKSENSPRYSAVDVASYRCGQNNAMLLLASATPSVVSYYKATEGAKYTLVELKERYGEAQLPEAVIVDMREEFEKGAVNGIGSRLRGEIKNTVDSGSQAVVFINRRGYSNYMSCPQCGEVIMCPNCSVSLTVHHHWSYSNLMCHYCGYSQPIPEKCPSCGGGHVRTVGYGTQKIEEELKNLFPENKVLRMDADTTGTKASYEEMLEAFRRGESDILLGTQMVTKGHDFPNVTLSGVLLADMSLYLDDYRAGERTFSLITQVVGRAGRGKKAGKAIIQTFNPEHPTLKLAAAQDYKSFYKNEIALRRALVFPPFCDIFLVSVTSRDANECKTVCERYRSELVKLMETNPTVKLQIFGPFEAPVVMVKNNYRWRLVIKGRSNKVTRAVLNHALKPLTKYLSGRATISIDVNPNNL